jgi:hypothetical protein
LAGAQILGDRRKVSYIGKEYRYLKHLATQVGKLARGQQFLHYFIGDIARKNLPDTGPFPLLTG